MKPTSKILLEFLAGSLVLLVPTIGAYYASGFFLVTLVGLEEESVHTFTEPMMVMIGLAVELSIVVILLFVHSIGKKLLESLSSNRIF